MPLPIQVHTHRLAPTGEHLRLLKEYRDAAEAEVRRDWYRGALVNLSFGPVHVRQVENPMSSITSIEITFSLAGAPYSVRVDVSREQMMATTESTQSALRAAAVKAASTELARYLAEHVLFSAAVHKAVERPPIA